MQNIIPINDNKDHVEGSACPCCPFVREDNGEIIIIHNSYDGRELIEQGYQKGLKVNVKTRSGEELEECDVVETIQGTKFFCVNFLGIAPKILNEKRHIFDLNDSMTPNLWKVGNLFDNPEMRNIFRDND